MAVQLRLVNQAQDSNSTVVIFNQPPIGGEGVAEAWKIIPNFASGDTCPFAYPQTSLWIGVAPPVVEGGSQNAIIGDIPTILDLAGIASADIIMSGGGPGPDPMPFTFQLANTSP